MAEIECPRCRGKIDPRATRCKHCQADFSPEEMAGLAKKREDFDKKRQLGCITLIGIVALLAMVGQCSSDSGGQNGSTPVKATAKSSSVAAGDQASDETADEPTSNWSYHRQMDEIRKREIVAASIRSENMAYFDFPYQGGSGLTMRVRKHPTYGQDVAFRIDKGQFLCGIYDCTGMISVDGRSETLTLVPSDDHDQEVLFAKFGRAIIGKLKGSEKVIVELPFYQEGARQFTFNTAGLEWPPQQ